MSDRLRQYPRLLRAAVQVTLTYRGRLLFLLTGALFPMLLLFVWLTVADEAASASAWDSSRFVSYYMAATVVHHLTSSDISWNWDADLRSGELSSKLLRPVPVFDQYIAAEAGSKLVAGVILVPSAVVLAAVVPSIDYPGGALAMVAAAAAAVVALALAALMSSTFALIGFWTTQSGNVYLLWWGMGAFLSGWIAPRQLMPQWLQHLAVALPFRYGLGFPIEIAQGLPTSDVAAGFGIAVVWTAAFVGAYCGLWRRGVRRFQAVGG